MGALVAPILPGKLDGWMKWADELKGPRKEEFRKFNARHGITQHRAWLQTGPDGSKTVIIVTDGPGADNMMKELAQATDEFDVWFRDHVSDAHGVDFKSPPPPSPELKIDAGN